MSETASEDVRLKLPRGWRRCRPVDRFRSTMTCIGAKTDTLGTRSPLSARQNGPTSRVDVLDRIVSHQPVMPIHTPEKLLPRVPEIQRRIRTLFRRSSLAIIIVIVSFQIGNRSARGEVLREPVLQGDTGQQLESFYSMYGGRAAFPLHIAEALEALLYAEDDIERGDLNSARMRVDGVFRKMPLSSMIWERPLRNHDIHLGRPVAYAGLRMLDQILALGLPSKSEKLRMTAVIAPFAQVTRPTLPGLEPENLRLEIRPEILANNAAVLHASTRLFRRWVQAITGGLEVELVVFVMDGGTTVDFQDDGKIITSYPDHQSMVESVPQEIARETDFWWVIAPSGVPGDGSGFGRHFITGGMTSIGTDLPLFLSDDAWFIRKPEHLGRGLYSDAERRSFLPDWFQHEFMHHLYHRWAEFNLEAEDHQWFDRNKWPQDFVGMSEPDYYAESINKRLLTARPSLSEGLQAKMLADLSQLGEKKLAGDYRREPVENGWHEVSIVSAGGNLSWTNAAGTEWALEVREGNLWAGRDCPYGESEVPVAINESGEVTAVYFLGACYQRVKGQP